MANKQLPYDPGNKISIEKYAKGLIGSTLRKAVGKAIEGHSTSGKGTFGNVLEKYFFQYEPNSESAPDFPEAGVELKSSPVKDTEDGLKAKERLVFNLINFTEICKENFEASSFIRKNALILFIFYLFEEDKALIDYMIKIAGLWEFPKEDLKIIRDDWEKIVSKIKAGKAHEISEGDTLYLGACTKGNTAKGSMVKQPYSAELAPQRAFALKTKYLNFVILDLLRRQKREELDEFARAERIVKNVNEYREGQTFEEYVEAKFIPFVGMDISEIHKKLGIKANKKAKSYYSMISRAILGVNENNKIEEFEKGDVNMKTVRLKVNGRPKEDISFPTFKYKEIAKESWEESKIRSSFSKRFFFVFFRYDANNHLYLYAVKFWNMPLDHLENEVHSVWSKTVKCIEERDVSHFPKKSENDVCHVRPHASNSKDTYPLPNGDCEVKRCFWLNSDYIMKQMTTMR